MATQTTLALDAITVDSAIQQRLSVNQDLVNEYAETIADWQHTAPLTVYLDSDGVHWLADGFHRHGAALKAKLSEVHVEIRTGDKRAAIEHSLSANAKHGQRRTAADLQKAYETAVALGLCAASDTEAVARLLACSTRRASDLTAQARAQGKEQQRAEILSRIDQGVSQREVAQQLGVSVGLVNNVVQKRHASKIERRALDPAPDPRAMAGSSPVNASENRAHLSDWQRALLSRLDAQVALNGRAGVVEAVTAWMQEVAQ